MTYVLQKKKFEFSQAIFRTFPCMNLVILQSFKEDELTLYYLIAKMKIQWRAFGTNRDQLQDSHTPGVLSIYCIPHKILSEDPQLRTVDTSYLTIGNRYRS